MQRKLESYFVIKPQYNMHIKKCFVYDPTNYRAFYCIMPESRDQYVTQKSGIKLYYRPPITDIQINIPQIISTYTIPLVKSNLQKAVRRGDVHIALQSALALIQFSPMELLRRLPIIYIEDGCLMDSYSIVVWLMMADKDYGVLKSRDIDILLHIVYSLCKCMTYYPYTKNDYNYVHTHESLQYSDELLSVYYRSLYGGMHGDMQMLKTSIDYYKMHLTEIMKTEYNILDYSSIKPEIDILMEAIDFHPYPQMLHMLQQKTRLSKDTIKQHIWFVESGYNIRKPETHSNYKCSNEWIKIEKYLEEVRYELIGL